MQVSEAGEGDAGAEQGVQHDPVAPGGDLFRVAGGDLEEDARRPDRLGGAVHQSVPVRVRQYDLLVAGGERGAGPRREEFAGPVEEPAGLVGSGGRFREGLGALLRLRLEEAVVEIEKRDIGIGGVAGEEAPRPGVAEGQLGVERREQAHVAAQGSFEAGADALRQDDIEAGGRVQAEQLVPLELPGVGEGGEPRLQAVHGGDPLLGGESGQGVHLALGGFDAGEPGSVAAGRPHPLRQEAEGAAGVVGGLDLGDQDSLLDQSLEEGDELLDLHLVAPGDRGEQGGHGERPPAGLLEEDLEHLLGGGAGEDLVVVLAAQRGGAPEGPHAVLAPEGGVGARHDRRPGGAVDPQAGGDLARLGHREQHVEARRPVGAVGTGDPDLLAADPGEGGGAEDRVGAGLGGEAGGVGGELGRGVTLAVSPAGGVCSRHRLEAVEQRAADQPDPLAEEGRAGEVEEGAAGAQEAGPVGVGVLGLESGDLGAAGEMVRDGGEQLRGKVAGHRVELRRGDAPAVVEGAAQGDDRGPGEPAAGRFGVLLPQRLARRRVEGIAERAAPRRRGGLRAPGRKRGAPGLRGRPGAPGSR